MGGGGGDVGSVGKGLLTVTASMGSLVREEEGGYGEEEDGKGGLCVWRVGGRTYREVIVAVSHIFHKAGNCFQDAWNLLEFTERGRRRGSRRALKDTINSTFQRWSSLY